MFLKLVHECIFIAKPRHLGASEVTNWAVDKTVNSAKVSHNLS